MLLAVAGDDRDGADSDLGDMAERVADGDHVARLYRAVHQQDDPGDQIAERLLQSEADGEAEGAGEDGERGQIDSEQVYPDEEGDYDDGDPGELLGEQLLGRIERTGALDRMGDDPVQKLHDRIEG